MNEIIFEQINEKNHSISLIRLIATIMIVTCHILQNIDNELAWWFNVGVQIFFVMSGFLYGRKIIENQIDWMIKRGKKILLNYYVFILAITIVYKMTCTYPVNALRLSINILGLQGFISGLPNIQHLWFITYILVCYAITPVLQSIFTHLNTKSEFHFWIAILLLVIELQILDVVGVINITVPWIACYAFGYAVSSRYFDKVIKEDKLNINFITLSLIPITIVLNGFKIYLSYIAKIKFEQRIINSLINLIFDYAHACLGITLFLGMFIVFNRILKNAYKTRLLKRVLEFSDKYSFDIYIVHQVFILGSFSLIGKTNYLGIDIFIIIMAVLTCGVLLHIISDIVNQWILKGIHNSKV